MHHKGQLSIQFNWIFILIVGVVILLFFFMLISNQQKSASQKEANELIRNIDTVFTTLSNEPNAVQEYNIPNAQLQFVCEEGLNKYYLPGADDGVDITYEPIFTQENLHGENIITWTKVWNVPFEAATFTMMANDRTLFIFVESTEHPELNEHIIQLYEDLPEEFVALHLSSLDEVDDNKPSGYDRYIYISSQSSVSYLQSHIGSKSVIRGIQILPTDSLYGSGQIVFATADEESSPQQYLLEAGLWGAIFSEDEDFYTCTMDKALKRFIVGASVLAQRADRIAGELSYTTCEPFLVQTGTILNSMILSAETFNLENMYLQREQLEDLASDSLRGYSCPYLY